MGGITHIVKAFDSRRIGVRGGSSVPPNLASVSGAEMEQGTFHQGRVGGPEEPLRAAQPTRGMLTTLKKLATIDRDSP
jgi:hypothetical protein